MKPGMTKVSVLYPNGEGKNFDIDYYCNKHIPMVAGLLGDAVKGASVEKGIANGDPDLSPPYAAVGNIYFESVEAFQKAFGPHNEKIMGDMPNYTNIEPVILVSEVMI